MLARMLQNAAQANIISGLLASFRKDEIMTLQYVDDTILFCNNDLESMHNMKFVLYCFEQI